MADLGRVLQRDTDTIVAGAGVETQRAFVEDFYVLGVRATPVGTLGRPKPGGRAGDPGHGTTDHPGYLRSSLWTSVGLPVYRRSAPTVFNPLPSIGDARSALRGAKLGAPVYLTYSAPYAASIELGLRTVRGQRYGSPQALEGWARPTAERIVKAHRGGRRIKAEIDRNLRRSS